MCWSKRPYHNESKARATNQCIQMRGCLATLCVPPHPPSSVLFLLQLPVARGALRLPTCIQRTLLTVYLMGLLNSISGLHSKHDRRKGREHEEIPNDTHSSLTAGWGSARRERWAHAAVSSASDNRRMCAHRVKHNS